MSSISDQVEALGPWITRFEFEGAEYGGEYRTVDDPRVCRFVAEVKTHSSLGCGKEQPLRILECGSLEGAHTAMLAQAFPDGEIIATDVREENLRKGRFLLSLRNLTNIRWIQDDLEQPRCVFAENYDAVFCVGLLYHLRNPAKFLARACRAAPFLWVWTIVCAEPEVTIVENGYHGRMLSETPDHPLSGVQPESFLPTVSSLVDMLWAVGFDTVELLGKAMTSNGNGPAVLLQAQRGAPSFRSLAR